MRDCWLKLYLVKNSKFNFSFIYDDFLVKNNGG